MDTSKYIHKGEVSYNQTMAISYVNTMSSLGQTKGAFDTARYKLLNINNWQEYSNIKQACICLANEYGEKLDRTAKQGDYIKMNLTTSQTTSKTWFLGKVTDLQYEMSMSGEELLFLKIAMIRPHEEYPKIETYHLIDENITNNFILKREGRLLTISFHCNDDRVKPIGSNLIGELNAIDKEVDEIFGLSGSTWKGLLKEIISDDLENNITEL